MKTILAVKAFILIVWISLCFYFGRNIHFSDQKNLFEALRNMSAVIFGIMGAWIAILHPDLLSHLSDPKKMSEKSMPDSRHLITPMAYAALGLAVGIIVGILQPIAVQVKFVIPYASLGRGISFATVGTLSLLQIWALVLSFVPYGKAKIAQEYSEEKTKKTRALAGVPKE